MSKKTPRKRETVTLGDEIVEYLGALRDTSANYKKRQGSKQGGKGAAEGQKSLNLLSCWQNIAPPRLLEHTDNVVYSTRSKETELLVYVDSSSYAAELSLDKELYRLSMQKELQKDIADIKFLVSKKAARRKK